MSSSTPAGAFFGVLDSKPVVHEYSEIDYPTKASSQEDMDDYVPMASPGATHSDILEDPDYTTMNPAGESDMSQDYVHMASVPLRYNRVKPSRLPAERPASTR